MNRFWVVWNERGGSPTVQHAQKSEAMREARRLAVKCPGEQFHVLESVCTIVKDDVRVISHDGERDEDVPF